MGYQSRLYAQDAATGRVDETLAALAAAASLSFQEADAAVAYATRSGVALLHQHLSATSPPWAGAKKRFLVSIDFGITEPDALVALAALPGAEVRVPNGLTVLGNRILRPKSTFHTKAYLFGQPGKSPFGVAVGSANMSVSALAVGAEATAVQLWTGRLAATERTAIAGAGGLSNWYADAWAAADPLASVLPTYRIMRRKRRPFVPPTGDLSPAVRAYQATASTAEVQGSLAVQLANAKSLWVKTEVLYDNRRGGKSGNQLDTPRGTRVFFGYPATSVDKNHVFGEIQVQVPGYAAVGRSVRFGNNSMDKINLPVPGTAGPPSYDNAYLIFEKGVDASGGLLYKLTVTDASGLATRKARAANTVDLRMNGGREYGLLF